MRRRLFIGLAAAFIGAWVVGACTASRPAVAPYGAPPRSTPPPSAQISPSHIGRLAPDFPVGYELAGVRGARSPAGFWGLGDDFTADPAECAALANPATGDAPPQGLAGSGAGGIVYAVVVASASPLVADPAMMADCPRFSMLAGRTSATTELVAAPQVDGVATVAMTTATHTRVEGGTVTDSQIHTVTAYLGDYLAFVAVITDPGAADPALPPDFAARLLVKAVATLRG